MTCWIMGDSIIYWAAHRALQRPEGVSLGLENINVQVTWKGTRGAKLADFEQALQSALASAGHAPDFLIIHLGTNNFIYANLQSMFTMITNTLSICQQLVPGTKIIWSDILTRLFFYQARDQNSARHCLRQINRFARNRFYYQRGYIVHHPYITADNHDLFYYDCLHLSDLGSDLFINNLKAAIETFVSSPHVVEFPPR